MLAIGGDHSALALKKEIMAHLEERKVEYKDFGAYTEESCDYPDIAKAVCRAILAGECERGILICGTGIGISISANRFKGIRAALCGDRSGAGPADRGHLAGYALFGRPPAQDADRKDRRGLTDSQKAAPLKAYGAKSRQKREISVTAYKIQAGRR